MDQETNGTSRPMSVPRRLSRGDTVAVVSPSGPGIAWWPHRAQRGISYLESLGLSVRMMPSAAKNSSDGKAGTPQERAEDLNIAFEDDSISGILCSIGGTSSHELVELVDYGLVSRKPKIFQGYSDVTVLHWALAKYANLRTFYGPMLTTGLAEYPRVFPYTDHWLQSAWFSASLEPFKPALEWTEEFLDFFQQLDLTRPRIMNASTGWVWLREGRADGWLMGGCLDVISSEVVNTDRWFNPSGSILLLEPSSDVNSLEQIDSCLHVLETAGVFSTIAGLVFGRPKHLPQSEIIGLQKLIQVRTSASQIPILASVDCSHTDPMLTLPFGALAQLDSNQDLFAIQEPATS